MILFLLHLDIILFPLYIVIAMLQNNVKTIKNLHRLKLKCSKPNLIFPPEFGFVLTARHSEFFFISSIFLVHLQWQIPYAGYVY